MIRYIIILALTIMFYAPLLASENGELSKKDELSLREIAIELREAILQRDLQGVLKHVSKNGLGCTDSQIPFSIVKKYLYDENSHLYMSLFDSVKFSEQCGSHYPEDFPAISDQEFFIKNRNVDIEIVQTRWNFVQVIFKSSVKGLYQREWDFEKEDGEWKLIYGFIVGSCSCG